MMRFSNRAALVTVCLLALLGHGFALHAAPKRTSTPCSQRTSLFDTDWRFKLGDLPQAQDPALDDSAWQSVSVPHDWAIAGSFDAANPSGGQGAFAPMGMGWYRKLLPAATCPGSTVVQFDGVMANSDVWINGHLLGHRPYGYASFRYDLTPFLLPKGRNVLAVRADNSQQPSSRFYQGAGIYRHVHLLHLPSIHFGDWTSYVRTADVTASSANIEVGAEVQNSTPQSQALQLHVTLLDSTGTAVATGDSGAPVSIDAGGTHALTAHLQLSHPYLWNLDDPALYTARLELTGAGKSGDAETVPFGIRDAHFEAATGFWLNGKNLKIKGVALHSDIGALGMAAPLSLWEHRLRAMQRMGANAVRTAHNEVAPEFLDLCDRLGMLVLDEYFDEWTVAKNKYDYHLYFRDWYLKDTHDGVMRDRNHPSIVAWSAGNEIHDTPRPEIAKPILAALVAEYHKDDPTRPVTQALFRPNASHDYDDGLADLLDVVGQNYRPNEILAAHEQNPQRKILGTENIHDRASWLAVRDNAPYSGLFIWSGTDYLGESRHWPLIGDASGLSDRTDWPKPDALEHESWWVSAPVVHIVRRVAPVQKAPTDPGYEQEQYRPRQVVFADWTPPSLDPHPEHVEVYSNCPQVTLLLNGADLGSKALPVDLAARTWDVPFAPGIIEARCAGPNGAHESLRTAGAPAALRLEDETHALGAGFDDVALLRATVVDANGTPVPAAALPLEFSISGPATILATDSADNAYSAPFADRNRTSYQGRAIVLVRATAAHGPVHLQVTSPSLRAATLDVPITR